MTWRRPALLQLLAMLALLPAALWALDSSAATPSAVRVQVTDADGVPVRDAVVELRPAGGPAGGPIRFPWRMAMAQRDLAFVPGTLLVAKGSTVAFPNLDRVRHSIYSFSRAARFEIELYGRDQTRTHAFTRAGSVSLGCNIHDDMRGYIRVTDTPFAAITDHNGYVTLTGMPAGKASLTVWHPRLRAPANEYRSGLPLRPGDQAHRVRVTLR
ncbi:MAG: methylamine utilization protein [Erythrobacter sp.]|jgi:hypothetical protein|nr:methylamine utilization protein [Erythrobacter sp.]